jgi:hypothetical protein
MFELICMLFVAFTVLIFQTFRGYLRKNQIQLHWYSWIVFAGWYVLFFLTLDLVLWSLYEEETRAAVVLGVSLWAICLALLPLLRKILKARGSLRRAGQEEVSTS